MKKRIRIFAVLFVFAFVFCSCEKEKKTCEELLLVGLDYGIDGYADNGYTFFKNADESSTFFMTENTKDSMYGMKFKSALDAACDFAIYVSASNPYEVAIFECYSKNDTDEILRMCYERADEKKIGLRFTEWETASKAIEITGYKNYVIFVFTDSGERNEEVSEEITALLR